MVASASLVMPLLTGAAACLGLAGVLAVFDPASRGARGAWRAVVITAAVGALVTLAALSYVYYGGIAPPGTVV